MLKNNIKQKNKTFCILNCKQKRNKSNSLFTELVEQKNQYSNISTTFEKKFSSEFKSNSLLSSNNVIEQCSEQRKQALNRRLRTNRMLIAMVSVFLWFAY